MAMMANYGFTGFIHSGETLPWEIGIANMGEVVAVAAYPTDGVPEVTLQVQNLRFTRWIDPSSTGESRSSWRWTASFEIVNLGGNGVDYELIVAGH